LRQNMLRLITLTAIYLMALATFTAAYASLPI
jgi:hypothetical protein